MNTNQFLLPENEPIFFPDSFQLPLFNDVMEQELQNILCWLKTQPINNDKLVENIDRIIIEIIMINATLMQKVDFTTQVKWYVCPREYELINPKIQVSKLSYVCNKLYTYKEMSFYFCFIMRTMGNYGLKSKTSHNDWLRYRFLYRFFLVLYSNMTFFTENWE